jgi:hypothetical protein
MAIYPYTVEQLYDNYEFKVVKRALMKQFPWIKDITVDQEQLDKYNLIFMDLDIDPLTLGEENGWDMTSWVKKATEDGKEYKGMYLSLFYDNVHYNDTRDLTNDMERTIAQIHQSPALPSDLKIKGDRRLSIGDFFVNRGGAPWFS